MSARTYTFDVRDQESGLTGRVTFDRARPSRSMLEAELSEIGLYAPRGADIVQFKGKDIVVICCGEQGTIERVSK